LVIALVAPGCTDAPGLVAPCEYPILGRHAKDGQSDVCCQIDPCPGHCTAEPCPDGSSPDAALDATITDGASGCSGVCAPVPPDGFSEPQLVWFGPSGTAPACPADAPVIAYQGHAQPVALPPASCSPCTCSPPSGTCEPPGHIEANGTTCMAPSPFGGPFNAPPGWDGTCTSYDAISANSGCADSTALCVQSLVAEPLSLADDACTPSETGLVSAPPPAWGADAVACKGNAYPLGGCTDTAVTCTAAPPPGFLVCIYHDGDGRCPASYPDKHLAYASLSDTRGCTSCACAAPSGSLCTATLSVFKEPGCTGAPFLAGPISSEKASCFDLSPAGLPLGGKTVTALAYRAGACAPSGGDPMGSVDPAGPSTFCCLVS
jgi:hypothetical protein